MERFSALIGFVGILAIAFLLSTNRRAIRWKTVFWGLTLQILTAIAVLKGTWIAQKFGTFMPGISPWIAALIFIALTVIVVQIAKRMAMGTARNGVWGFYLIVSAVLFLSYNLLAFLFQNLKDVVTELISYTAEGSKFVFGPLGDPANTNIGFVFAFRVLPTIIFIASIFAVLYYLGVMQIVVRFFAKLMARFPARLGAAGPLEVTEAEVVHAVHVELARHLEDVLARRTKLWLDGDAMRLLAGPVSRWMAPHLGWDEVARGREVDRVTQALDRERDIIDSALEGAATP